MTENGVLISLKNVSVFYDGKAVISGVSADIFRGEIFCILGESGGGKTTLLNILSGLVSPDEGEITYAGGAAPRCSYVFQEASLLPNLTALKNLTFAGGEKTYCGAVRFFACGRTVFGSGYCASGENHRFIRFAAGREKRGGRSKNGGFRNAQRKRSIGACRSRGGAARRKIRKNNPGERRGLRKNARGIDCGADGRII